jgi:hypothetical protein
VRLEEREHKGCCSALEEDKGRVVIRLGKQMNDDPGLEESAGVNSG